MRLAPTLIAAHSAAALLMLLPGCSGSSTFQGMTNGKAGDQQHDDTNDGDDGDGSSADQTAGGDDDGGSDEPAWVNGAYLTCAWSEALSETSAAIGCGLRAADGVLVRAQSDVLWTAKLADGTEVTSAISATGEPVSAVLDLAAELIPDIVIVLSLPEMAKGFLSTPLHETLAGFDVAGDLAGCLRGGGALSTCLASVGIDLGSGATPPPGSHTRSVVGGTAYYLGLDGESCTDVCASYGGIHDATISETGSGGSALACVDALASLATISVLDNQTAAVGLGCHVSAAGDGLRVTTPVTTQEAKAPGARRVCACQL